MRHPTKTDCLRQLKSLGLPIGAILDIGVLSATPELIAAFSDHRHVLVEPIVEWNPSIAAHYAGVDHEVVNAAASDADGSVTLEVQSVIPGMTISHARMADGIRAGCEAREVPMVTVDSLVARRSLPEPFLLKIDVDGAEVRILRGARRTLPRCSVVIIEAGVQNFWDRAEPLREAGFELFDLVGLAYYDGRLCQFDAVFVNGAMMRERRLGMFEQPFDITKWVNYDPR